MSYILEALKKAELQRGMGQVPGIGSQHEKPAHPATGKWFWIGVAFLILNLVLLTLLLWPDSDTDSGDRYSQELPQRDPVIQEPAQANAPTPVPSPPPPSVAPPAQRAAPDTRLPAAAPPVAKSAPMPVPSSRPVVPAQHAAPDDTPSPVAAEPVPSPAPVVESSVPAEFETEPEEEFDYEEEADSDINSLPVWPQIPDHLFQQLTGGIPLDVHVYSKIPEDRFVLINLQKYREGEQLQEGPLLDEITPEGVILSFQGQQFLVRAQ